MADRYSSSSSSTYSSHYPSFSSTLLDSIYRSIDSAHEAETTAGNSFNGGPLRKTKPTIDFEPSHHRRASMIDTLQRKNYNPSALKVKTTPATTNRAQWEPAGSDPVQRPIPVPKKKQESGFLKTKSRALKMYGELKKANKQQPISPGKKLAGFLNSLFFSNSDLKKTTKSKVASRKDDFTPKSTVPTTSSSSACSSATSFSRSCLSKTPSSSRKSTATDGAVKRSVKFSSVSTIIDGGGDSPHYDNSHGRKTPAAAESNNSRINYEIMARVVEEKRRAEEAAMDFLRNCRESSDFDDDRASCASSDLFELDNLSSIGLMETAAAYEDDDELPIYETTHLQKNRGFANGTTTMVV